MDQVSQVREKTDIVSLIQEYVPLKKVGRNFKANCPFHNEKSPSFIVSPERQIWRCFGCARGGDAFSFLMEYERMEFPEALRILAQKAGVELVHTHIDSGIQSKKEKIYGLNRLAAEYYHFVLTKHAVGKSALAYLEERKIKQQTMKTFSLGFAPATGTALSTYLLKKKGYQASELLDAGLAIQYGTQIRDFFHGRLMFPLCDHRGNVIGFSGRVLDDNKQNQGPKYINTKETVAYHKGSVFFGLNISLAAIKKENRAIIMEGEFDVISSFQEGITNTVAIKGTALTEEQVRLLNRFAKKISLCLDKDKAGQDALKRSVGILEKTGVTITVIVLENAKDADDAIKNNPVAFKQSVKHDLDVYEFLLQQTLATASAKTVEGKKQIADELLPFFMHIENAIIKEHYLKKLSDVLQTSYETILQEEEKLHKKEVIRHGPVITKTRRSREEVLEEYFISLFAQHETLQVLKSIDSFTQQYQYTIPAYQKILERLLIYAKSHQMFSVKEFTSALPQELLASFDSCFLLPIPKFTDEQMYEKEVKRVARELHTIFLQKEIKKLGELIKAEEEKGDEITLNKLHAELSMHMTQLHKKNP